MPVFTVFELKSGWIQKLGPIHLKEIPLKGELIGIASAEAEEGRCYEVLEMEPPTDAASGGFIVLTLIPPGSLR
jgi:hypothetical protein